MIVDRSDAKKQTMPFIEKNFKAHSLFLKLGYLIIQEISSTFVSQLNRK